VIKKIVVILHRKTDENRVLVDVPWCNGSTRVFGSLSHRSNRCGTTSPSRALLAPSPFWQGSYSSQCLHDTAFFVLFLSYSLSNFRFSWLLHFSASSHGTYWKSMSYVKLMGGFGWRIDEVRNRGHYFFLCSRKSINGTINGHWWELMFKLKLAERE